MSKTEILYGIVVIIIIGLIIANVVIRNGDKRIMSGYTVTDKQIKTEDKHGKYLVYTKDENNNVLVMEVTDTVWRWRFNSSDEYASIEIGKTYNFIVCGQRIPFLSMYPNILKHEVINNE